MIVARALKNSQLTCGERHAYFGDRTIENVVREEFAKFLRDWLRRLLRIRVLDHFIADLARVRDDTTFQNYVCQV